LHHSILFISEYQTGNKVIDVNQGISSIDALSGAHTL